MKEQALSFSKLTTKSSSSDGQTSRSEDTSCQRCKREIWVLTTKLRLRLSKCKMTRIYLRWRRILGKWPLQNWSSTTVSRIQKRISMNSRMILRNLIELIKSLILNLIESYFPSFCVWAGMNHFCKAVVCEIIYQVSLLALKNFGVCF